MMKFRPLISLIALAGMAVLQGCASFAKDNAPQPVTLEPIHETVHINKAWQESTGVGTDKQYIQLAPLFLQQSIYTIDKNGHLEKRDEQSGRLLWATNLPYQVTGGLGEGNSQIYFGSNQGELIALNPANGEVLWHRDLGSEILSRPIGKKGIVVVHLANGDVAALDAQSGKEKWIFEGTPPSLTLRGSSSPILLEDYAIVGLANGRVAVFNLESGDEQLEQTVSVPRGRSELQRLVDINSDVLIDDGVMYAVSYQGSLVALDIRDGRVLWQREMSSYRNLDIDKHAVYLTDADSVVWSIDRTTGDTLWKQDNLLHRALSAPRVVGGYVVVGDYEGYLHVLATEHGQLVGRSKVASGAIVEQPLVVGKDLIVTDQQGILAELNLNSMT